MKVLRKMEYKKDYRIYIMQFGNVFQYLITDKDKNLYQDHLVFPSSKLNKIKHRLHLIPVPYTKEEMKAGEDMVLSGAIRSIDALIEGKKQAAKESKKISEVAQKRVKNKDCVWQAVEDDTGMMAYECLTHLGDLVPLIDGEQPYHREHIEEGAVLSPLQFAK